MASRNDDAVANQQQQETGQFHARKPRDEPQTTTGHKPGVMASPNDGKPEFHAQVLPPGTAPPESSYKPDNSAEVPAGGNAQNTLPGSTSADVHTDLGHPGQGQTSTELRHDGKHTASKDGTGLVGVGASGAHSTNQPVNPHDPAHANQRALNDDNAEVGRGNIGGPAAEERLPVSAEQVASERK